MNGLNSLALHVGVDLFLLLAEISSVLKELFSDWSGFASALWAMVEVGYFVTLFIVDIFTGAAVGMSAQRRAV